MEDQRTSHVGGPVDESPPFKRILVLDDDVLIRSVNADVLRRSGYQVDTAGDGETGWSVLRGSDYDLLLTDNIMPRMSGVELVQKLRSTGATLPVILVSGSMPAVDSNGGPGLQLAAMLMKPFDDEELLTTVQRVLHGSEQTRKPTKSSPAWRSQPSVHGLRTG